MPFCDQMFAFMINESANWDVVHLLQSITHQIRQMSWLSRRCRIAKAIYICFYETGHYCSSSFQTTHLFCKFNIRHDALVLISPYLRGPQKGLPILSDNVHLWYLNILACCYKSQLLNPICTSHTTTSATGHPSWHCSSPSSPSWWWSWPTTPQTLEPFQSRTSRKKF